MATGPFQVDPNSARPIADIQLRGGFDTLVPQGSRVGDAAEAITQVAQVVEGVNKDRAKEKLRTELGAVTRALQASRFPDSVEGDLITQEGRNNPINQAAIKEMQMIVNAGLQGKLPQYAVVERVNVLLNDAVSAAPEWREELHQVAREMMGFNPQAEMVNQLLSQPRAGSGRLTAAEKLQEEADALGISVDSLRSIRVQELQTGAEMAQLALAKSRGEYGAAEAARESYLSAGELTKVALGQIQASVKSGQPLDVERFKATITQGREQLKQNMLNSLGPGASVSTINAMMDQLDSVTDGLFKLADDRDALAILTKHNKTFVSMSEKDVYAIQGVGQMYAILGPRGLDAVMSALDRYSSNPKALQMFMKSGQPGSGALNLATMFKGMTESVTRMESGVESTTDEQKKLDLITGQALLQQRGLTGGQAAPIMSMMRRVGMGKEWGEYGTIKAMSDGKVVSELSKVKEVHGELINIYNSELARLTLEYDSLASRGYIPKGGVTTDGTAIQTAPFVNQRDDNGASAAYNDWVKKVNNLTNFASKYSGTGVFPKTVYNGLTALAADLNKREKPGITDDTGKTAPTQQTVVKFGRDTTDQKIKRLVEDIEQ